VPFKTKPDTVSRLASNRVSIKARQQQLDSKKDPMEIDRKDEAFAVRVEV